VDFLEVSIRDNNIAEKLRQRGEWISKINTAYLWIRVKIFVMNENNLSSLPEPNPKTQAIHKREVLWQITIPLVLVGALALGVAVMAIIGGSIGDSHWADISLIALLALAIILSLLILVILAGLAVGVWVLNRNIPPYAHLVQNYLVLARQKVEEFSNLLVEPVMRLNGWKAGVSAAEKDMFKTGKRKQPQA